jgi:hypothetical protein
LSRELTKIRREEKYNKPCYRQKLEVDAIIANPQVHLSRSPSCLTCLHSETADMRNWKVNRTTFAVEERKGSTINHTVEGIRGKRQSGGKGEPPYDASSNQDNA